MALALVTGVGAWVLGGGGPGFSAGAAIYVAATWLALARSVVLSAQVAVGVALAAGLLWVPGGPGAGVVTAVVAGVLATAELTTASALGRGPTPRPARPALIRAVGLTLTGSVLYLVVAWTARVPGPGGVAAIAIASGACIGLGALLVRSVGLPGSPEPSILAGEGPPRPGAPNTPPTEDVYAR